MTRGVRGLARGVSSPGEMVPMTEYLKAFPIRWREGERAIWSVERVRGADG